MSYRKFALVPYKDYQLMTEHKCIKNDSDTSAVEVTHTHNTADDGVDTTHNKPPEEERVQTHPTTSQVNAPTQQVAETPPQLTNAVLYKHPPGSTKRIVSSKKRKSVIPNTDSNKPTKVYNTKRKKASVTTKSDNFTWLGM
jgi:hypothetical protein